MYNGTLLQSKSKQLCLESWERSSQSFVCRVGRQIELIHSWYYLFTICICMENIDEWYHHVYSEWGLVVDVDCSGFWSRHQTDIVVAQIRKWGLIWWDSPSQWFRSMTVRYKYSVQCTVYSVEGGGGWGGGSVLDSTHTGHIELRTNIYIIRYPLYPLMREECPKFGICRILIETVVWLSQLLAHQYPITASR